MMWSVIELIFLFLFTVHTVENKRCRSSPYITVDAPTGYIANFITMDTGLGSLGCPWRIAGGPGQKVTISLIDFAVWREDLPGNVIAGPPEKSGICHIYAQIREQKTRSSITLCGGETREKVVYTSESSSVELEVVNNRAAKEPAFFLLKYEGMWTLIKDDTICFYFVVS